jgi:Phage integrase family
MIAVSPCLSIALPEIAVNRDFIVPTAAQTDGLAAGLPGDWAATVWLMHGCGLRVGEALAVSEQCIISDRTVPRVCEQVNPQGQLRPLKFRSAGDYRDTPLPQYVSDAIDKDLADYGTTGDGYLFRGRRQKLVVRRTYQDDFARAARKAGLPPQFIPHSLRHYFASTALARGSRSPTSPSGSATAASRSPTALPAPDAQRLGPRPHRPRSGLPGGHGGRPGLTTLANLAARVRAVRLLD